jgi:dTMP kinase
MLKWLRRRRLFNLQRDSNHLNQPKYYSFPDRNTETGKKINDFLQKRIELDDKQVHRLFTENRLEIQEDLKANLLKGVCVVADRYAYSGAAFSAAKGVEGMDLHWCFEGEIGLPAPDVVLYMNVSPEVAKKRGGFGEERYEVAEFQAKVRLQFDKIISLSPSWDELELTFNQQAKQAKAQAQTENGVAPTDSAAVTTSATPTNNYLSPWYKVCSDDDFDDVAQRVQYIATKVLEVQKVQPVHFIAQFPLAGSTSNIHDDFPKF